MRTREFCGREVSVVALGSTDFGGNCPEALAHDLLDAFAELGGNFIDTAHMYGCFNPPVDGLSERVIGHWMDARHCRDSLFLSTKGGHPRLSTMHIGRLSCEELSRDISESLDELHTDHVDIYWLHRDDVSRPVGDIMETLQGFLEKGYTHNIGASNWSLERLEAANAYAAAHGLTPFCANQPRFSLAEQMTMEDPTLVPMSKKLYAAHLKSGMPCVPFSSQAKGFFTKLDALGADDLPEKTRRRFYAPENLATYERMKTVSAETGLSIGAIAVAWLTCQPFPVIPLVGASRVEHVLALRESTEAVLTDAQRDYVRDYPNSFSA